MRIVAFIRYKVSDSTCRCLLSALFHSGLAIKQTSARRYNTSLSGSGPVQSIARVFRCQMCAPKSHTVSSRNLAPYDMASANKPRAPRIGSYLVLHCRATWLEQTNTKCLWDFQHQIEHKYGDLLPVYTIGSSGILALEALVHSLRNYKCKCGSKFNS